MKEVGEEQGRQSSKKKETKLQEGKEETELPKEETGIKEEEGGDIATRRIRGDRATRRTRRRRRS